MKNSGLLTAIVILVTLGCHPEKSLFELQSPDKTGIHFSNRITENDTFNILTYEYVYNGGGVGVGDFNNDGLQDLFFSANMNGNRLYLNRGDFKFEDITREAGVEALEKWNSGVSVVDINHDGWLDLYVCATTYHPAPRRANSLFVNNGISDSNAGLVTFTEDAKAFGLADESHTTNAAFFDYDNDGDLDVYLLVNQMDEHSIPNQYRKKITDGTSHRTDKLFRNDYDEDLGHAVFSDISRQAGITIEGFGLGLNICDINHDGWKDIYVTNDYITNDLLWINSGKVAANDSTEQSYFTNLAPIYFKHTSHSAMGNDVADLNNDGLPDIVSVDMLPEDNLRRKTMLPPNNYNSYINNDRYGYQYQYVRNMLQLNQGKKPGSSEPIFSDISMLSEISSTDWSWAPLAADFDNDGFRDLIITNGFPNDVTDRDFMDYNSEKGSFVTRDQLLDLIPSVKIKNYAFQNQLGDSLNELQRNTKIPLFENVGKQWGLRENSFSNGAVYTDLDNDGDLDLVINNINDSAFIYKNTLVDELPQSSNWLKIKFRGSDKNPQGLGAIIQLYYNNGQQQYGENSPYRGYLSSVENGLHFGLGPITFIDSLLVYWQEGQSETKKNINANQTLTLDIRQAINSTRNNALDSGISNKSRLFHEVGEALNISYVHPESDFIDFNVQPLLLHKLSQYGPSLSAADINNDGLDDLYLSGSRFNKGQFFIQEPDGRFVRKDLLPGPDGDSKRQEELGTLFFDADGDGDDDLYLVSGGYEFDLSDSSYQDRLFLNEGGHYYLAKNNLPAFLSSGSCVKAADFDQDGDLDLFVGGRVLPFQYPKPVSSYLLVNDGSAHFSIANGNLAPELDSLGMICDALWTDFDNDGWIDLMLAGDWMPLQFLRNENGILRQDSSYMLKHTSGWWNSLVSADFDLDGDIDYIAGNLGLNTLLKGSPINPVAIYVADFDANSDNDPNISFQQNTNRGLDAIPTAYFPDQNGQLVEFPFFGRMDMQKQMIAVKRMYLKHHRFGQVPMQELINQFPDVKPFTLKSSLLSSVYIENLGDAKFAVRDLPLEVQVAPIYGMVTGDFNHDQFPDVLLTGNDFGTEVSMGRYDAFNGLLLTGDGQGNFTAVSMEKSGICIPGDGKSLVSLQSKNGNRIIAAGQNRGPLLIFESSDSTAISYPLNPLDCTAIIELKNGRTYREELPYSQSFLSQSSRRLWLSREVSSCKILDFSGKIRHEEIL